MDICVMLFLLTVLISCMISPEGGEAFWGNSGRRLGGAYLLLCGGVYIAVSRFYKESGVLLWTFLVANSGMWLLVVCDLWGLDPLGMYESLDPAQHMYFIGTMGNININSGYSGVCTALMMGLYHLGQGRLTKICFWSASVLGVYACCCTRSDSWLLAVGSGMLLLLGISMREGGLLKWCGVAAAFFCGLTFMKVTEWLDKVTGWGNKYIEDLRGQGMLYALIDEKVLLALGLALLVFFFHSGRSPFDEREIPGSGEKIWELAAGGSGGGQRTPADRPDLSDGRCLWKFPRIYLEKDALEF